MKEKEKGSCLSFLTPFMVSGFSPIHHMQYLAPQTLVRAKVLELFHYTSQSSTLKRSTQPQALCYFEVKALKAWNKEVGFELLTGH